MSEETAPYSAAITTEPYSRNIEQLITIANQWAERLLGEAATQLGGVLADRVGHWRTEQAARLLADSQRRAATRGIVSARVVSPAFLIPLLEAASLETNEDLRNWWTELLTNAADPKEAPVSPVFPRTLAELSSLEVRLLDWMYIDFPPDASGPVYSAVTYAEVQQRSRYFGPVSRFEFEVVVTNLNRLGLCVPFYYTITRSGGSGSSPRYETLALSPLGGAFVRACRDPQRGRRVVDSDDSKSEGK